MDRSSILRASTIYDQGEPFHEGFAFFVAPSWGDTMTSRKEAGAFRGGDAASRGRASPAARDSDPHSRAKEREQAGGPPYEQLKDEHL